MTGLPPLPDRPREGHKGTFGTVIVLGGQCAGPRVMVGGPALAALAALRVGAGLSVLAVPRPIVAAALAIAPTATGLALPVDKDGRLDPSGVAEMLDAHAASAGCLAIGPGLGDDGPQQQIVARLAARDDVPMVLDADALNALSRLRQFDRDLRAPAVITPHPGEFRRLADALRLDADPIDPRRRPDAAAALARRLGCVVVLKGAGTVVSDGHATWTCAAGNPVLATGGSGDVLTGVIAGLIAQYARGGHGAAAAMSLYDAARLGVQLHALAADRWRDRAGDRGMLATDLLDEIPGAIAAMR